MIDSPMNLSDVLRATAMAHPRRTAVVDEQGELSYREFDQQVDALGSFLCRLGVGEQESVAYLFWNQREILISYHAITRINAVTVSLNYRLTADELAYQLDASGARAIIYDSSFQPLVDQAVAVCKQQPARIEVGAAAVPEGTHSFREAITEPVDTPTLARRSPAADAISGIWFTSGTEGKPKGAAVRHRSGVAAAMYGAAMIGISRDTRCLAVAPMFHRGAMEDIALPVTLMGGTHYLPGRFNPAATLKALSEHRITLAFIVPTMAHMLLRELDGARHPLPDLQAWVSASAPMPVVLERRICESFGLRGTLHCYGITEMLFVATWHTTPENPYDGSVGFALPGVKVRIYDDERGILPPGEVGEIIIRGPVAFSHYVNNPAATQAATLLIDGEDWYRSGDAGRLDEDGRLTILDRRKDMILSGGENIYSVEVEEAIVQHPAVAEVAVVGREEEQWGEVVVAFVVARPGERPTLDSIRSACSGLATYKHPKEVVFVDALPRNSFGKVQKPALKQRLAGIATSLSPGP